MTSMIHLISRHDPLDTYLPEACFRRLAPWLDGSDAEVPNLPRYRVVLYPHAEGQAFAIQRQAQSVIAGAVGRTPRAARELWRVLDRLRQGGLPESEPVGSQHPGNNLWAELSLINFSNVSPADAALVSQFAVDLFRAIIRREVERSRTLEQGARGLARR